MSRRPLALIAAASTALAGCAVGPDYHAPSKLPGAAPFVSASQGPFTAQQPPGDWWRLYQDPALDALVAEALAHNKDIAVAAANLAQVRASLSETRAGLLPSTTVSGAASRVRQQSQVTGQTVEADVTSVGFDVGYEVDLVGRLRRSIEASRADTGAAQAALDLARVSVAAETARAYAGACAANAQLSVANRTLELLRQTSDLTNRLLEAGSGNGLDVSRAGAQLDTTRATLPPIRAQRDAALFRLSVLVGRPPAEISPAARDCAAPPRLTSLIPVGDGAALLARRPDVRQAERHLAAATARVGVATAALYPSVSLGGSVSTAGTGGQNLGDGYQFSLGPLISWTFPNILAARARIAQSDAAADAALAAFEQTTLTALQETETALNAYARELDRLAALRAARDQSQRAVRLSRLRQTEGLDSFLSTLDADRTLASLEAQVAQSEATVADLQITLFKALGGGWQTAPAT